MAPLPPLSRPRHSLSANPSRSLHLHHSSFGDAPSAEVPGRLESRDGRECQSSVCGDRFSAYGTADCRSSFSHWETLSTRSSGSDEFASSSGQDSGSSSTSCYDNRYLFINPDVAQRSPSTTIEARANEIREALLSTYLLSQRSIATDNCVRILEHFQVHSLHSNIDHVDNIATSSFTHDEITITRSCRQMPGLRVEDFTSDGRPCNLEPLQLPRLKPEDSSIDAIIDRAWHYHNVGEPLSPYTRITLRGHCIDPPTIDTAVSFWRYCLKCFMSSFAGHHGSNTQPFCSPFMRKRL